jgi:ATPases involved in chromosome partitioning
LQTKKEVFGKTTTAVNLAASLSGHKPKGVVG